MKIIKTDPQGRNEMYTKLDSYCRSINKRSVTYTIEPYSKYFASITIQMVGKRATAHRKIIIYNDDGKWNAITNGIEYALESLSEITTILKAQVSKLSGWVNKF